MPKLDDTKNECAVQFEVKMLCHLAIFLKESSNWIKAKNRSFQCLFAVSSYLCQRIKAIQKKIVRIVLYHAHWYKLFYQKNIAVYNNARETPKKKK